MSALTIGATACDCNAEDGCKVVDDDDSDDEASVTVEADAEADAEVADGDGGMRPAPGASDEMASGTALWLPAAECWLDFVPAD
jgi:hypothetical protein